MYITARQSHIGAMRTLLNVGGNSKEVRLPPQFDGFKQLLLDIDPNCMPDIVCDARELHTLSAGQFDAIYCSHNLEHYYRHEVPKVLAGFLHVLKEGGIAFIRVPDVMQVMQAVVERGLDIDDPLYTSRVGPILVSDVIYGYGKEIEESGQDFFAHKTGFSAKSLQAALIAAGFSKCFTVAGSYETIALAFKGTPDAELVASTFRIE